MSGCFEYNQISRRNLLISTARVGVALALAPSWLPKVAYAESQDSSRDVLISIFMRGGIDGLSLCIPHGDPDYYKLRPTIAFPDHDSKKPLRVTTLDGFYGLAPGLACLKTVYDEGNLLFIHATGAIAGGWSRSHFDAQKWMELGKPNDLHLATGWLGRHLASSPAVKPGAILRGVSLSQGTSLSLFGGSSTLGLPDLTNGGLLQGWDDRNALIEEIRASYGNQAPSIQEVANHTFRTLGLLEELHFDKYAPAGGAKYPDSELGNGLKSAAALIRAEVGVEAITIDAGGFDTHKDQGIDGQMGNLLDDLGKALLAFNTDLAGAPFTRFTLVGMSEFGRTVKENDSRGTDHGTGNAMFLMGPNVKGSRIYAKWPGLAPDKLFEAQDLAVTTDYRDVLAELVAKHLGNGRALPEIFPGYTPQFRDLLRG